MLRTPRGTRLATAVSLGGLVLVGLAAPASARPVAADSGGPTTICVEPDTHGDHDSEAAARGGHGDRDHRDVSPAEQRAIEKRTRAILAEKRQGSKGRPGGDGSAARVSVPVYVHEMRAANGAGDVTPTQISQQIAVLNETFAGESSVAADTGFTFYLAGSYEYFNNAWHQDRQSSSYRKATRKGGAGALNMWLVDFDYLGIATFPWDYKKQSGIDGIRVNYASLPGGSIANYDLGKTATHEAGHWFGLYHTFQGGCTTTNDSVADTPAQSSATNGCPEGRDSCSLPGLDPIHNYMDYSYDDCYDQFSPGQSSRMSSMWTAYRS